MEIVHRLTIILPLKRSHLVGCELAADIMKMLDYETNYPAPGNAFRLRTI